jgi:hypothetical protein
LESSKLKTAEVKDKRSGDTRMVDVHTFLVALLKCQRDMLVSLMKLLPGKNQNFMSWDCYPQVPGYQDL